MGQVGQPSQGGQAGQAGMVGLGGATSQDGGSIPGIQPLEMAAADFGNLRAQHSAMRQRGAAMAGQREGVGWLYARIYCAGGDDTDALLPEGAQWLTRARGQWDIRSAHFLRFVEALPARGEALGLTQDGEPTVAEYLVGLQWPKNLGGMA